MDLIELLALQSEGNTMAAECNSLAARFQDPSEEEIGKAREAINTFTNAVNSAKANPAAASEAFLASALRRASIALERLRSLSEAAGDFPVS